MTNSIIEEVAEVEVIVNTITMPGSLHVLEIITEITERKKLAILCPHPWILETAILQIEVRIGIGDNSNTVIMTGEIMEIDRTTTIEGNLSKGAVEEEGLIITIEMEEIIQPEVLQGLIKGPKIASMKPL
jgi:hypothetical protein